MIVRFTVVTDTASAPDDDTDACYSYVPIRHLALVVGNGSRYGPQLIGRMTPSDHEGGGDNMTALRRLSAQYLRERVQRHEIARTTALRHQSVLANFVKSYGGRDVAKMGRKDIERWQASREHLGAGSRRTEYTIVRCFVRWLAIEKKTRVDPMVAMRGPKVPRSVPRALSDAEMRRLWAVLPDARARAIIALMVGVGLRRGEVVGLQTGDWDRESATLRVVGKGGHTRLVPVPSRVDAILTVYLVGLRAGPLVRAADGVKPLSNSWMGRLVRGWLEEANVKTDPYDGRACHSFRHTLASRVADVEPDLRVLQQILGHEHLTSTQIYLRHAEMGKLRAAMERPRSKRGAA